MVDHVAGDDARRRLRTVLVGVVAKVGERRVRAGHHGLREAIELVADRAEELMLGPHAAGVLPRRIGVGVDREPRRMHVLFAERQHPSRLVVRPDDGA